MGKNIKSKIPIKNFVDKYFDSLEKSFKKIPTQKILQASNLILRTIKKKNTIFVCGNGGSAAIANHFVCDYFKQLSKYTNLKAEVKSLNSDPYLISAIANDISYGEVFKIQAERLIKRNDILLLISSSGNSKNIINVLKYCNKKKIKTIGFSNFNGGYLNKHAFISIHSKINNYGIGEDINHILMHLIMQYVALNNLEKNNLDIIL